MAHEGKIRAITEFVQGVEDLKLDVKADAEKILRSCPLEILDDPEALTDFLEEMIRACVEKHVITPEKKLRPKATKLIRAYVAGLTGGAK